MCRLFPFGKESGRKEELLLTTPEVAPFSEKQREMILADSKVREVMNVLTENEIRDVIRNKVETLSLFVK